LQTISGSIPGNSRSLPHKWVEASHSLNPYPKSSHSGTLKYHEKINLDRTDFNLSRGNRIVDRGTAQAEAEA
jgi:hypothetical protein